MKSTYLVCIIAVVFLVSGLVLTVSSSFNEERYYASGKVMLDEDEFADLKEAPRLTLRVLQ